MKELFFYDTRHLELAQIFLGRIVERLLAGEAAGGFVFPHDIQHWHCMCRGLHMAEIMRVNCADVVKNVLELGAILGRLVVS